MMKSKLLAAAMISMTLTGASKATSITYAVSLFDNEGATVGTVAVAGSITTDGTLGPLAASNIVDWSLVGVLGNPFGVLEGFAQLNGPLSHQNSLIIIARDIVAAPTALALNGVGAYLDFFAIVGVGRFDISFLETNNGNNFEVCSMPFGCIASPRIILADGVFADAKVVPAGAGAPGPVIGAGLPGLLLACCGLFAWWRRRRRQIA